MKTSSKTGVLLINLGTPAAPTPKAVKDYLKKFLSDPKVIDLPRWFWLPLLHGVILPIRSKRSAKLYQSIWTEHGSPLLDYSQGLANQVGLKLGKQYQCLLAMRYSQPSIEQALDKLQHCDSIIVLPLYPQLSHTTTTTSIDVVKNYFKHKKQKPKLKLIKHYYDHEAYIKLQADLIKQHWKTHKPAEKLIVSFHGLPQRYIDQGDPYYKHCKKTAALIAEQLKLNKDQWLLTFQSRVGKAKWLQPYTLEMVGQLARDGIQSIDVICPGFAVDCLETLEEIAMQNKEAFIQNGGKDFRYIACANDSKEHANVLCDLIGA